MRKRVMRKLFALVMTLALVMTSGLCVFAASSPTVGKVSGVTSNGYYPDKTLEVSWNKVDNAVKYNVYLNGKKVATVTGTSTTLTGMKGNTNYDIEVAAVGKNGKEGEKSPLVSKSGSKRWFKQTKIKKAIGGKKKVTVTWKKTSGATAYQIYQYKGGKWKLIKTCKSSKRSYTVKKLKKGKKYKFKVRAVKGSYLGLWSSTKSAKAK